MSPNLLGPKPTLPTLTLSSRWEQVLYIKCLPGFGWGFGGNLENHCLFDDLLLFITHIRRLHLNLDAKVVELR